MSRSETSTSQSKVLNFEQALLQWFNQATQLNTQVNSLAVMEKAKNFSVKFKLNFKPNTAWLMRWKKRQNLNMDMIIFSHPAVRSRLEQLMGSNIVRITDRRYMQKLQERIREDHMQCLERRIKEREEEEFEREKQLVLDGKLPLECAGKELSEHPVFKISKITSKIIDKRRSKMKMKKLSIPYYPPLDGEAEGEIGWKEAAAVAGEVTVPREDEVPVDETEPSEPTLQSKIEEDVEKGYLFPLEVYERLKYESPLIKELRQIETVDELYQLADQIVGSLKLAKQGVCRA